MFPFRLLSKTDDLDNDTLRLEVEAVQQLRLFSLACSKSIAVAYSLFLFLLLFSSARSLATYYLPLSLSNAPQSGTHFSDFLLLQLSVSLLFSLSLFSPLSLIQ